MTYVNHEDLSDIYCGDMRRHLDYQVHDHMHPFDGRKYRYVPESKSWVYDDDAHWEEVRKERNLRIENFMWKVQRQRDRIDLGLAEQESIIPYLEYIQELRDIPQNQTDPLNIVYPTEPE